MPGAFLLARELMLILSSSIVKTLLLIGSVSCTIFLTGFLFSVTGWPKKVAKWTSYLSILTSAVSPLRRPVADEVFPVISLIVSQALFAWCCMVAFSTSAHFWARYSACSLSYAGWSSSFACFRWFALSDLGGAYFSDRLSSIRSSSSFQVLSPWALIFLNSFPPTNCISQLHPCGRWSL